MQSKWVIVHEVDGFLQSLLAGVLDIESNNLTRVATSRGKEYLVKIGTRERQQELVSFQFLHHPADAVWYYNS